ncbi:MAG: DUF294 nucleotidyltransferase-like domain-containing protein [Flammeovirgaceae bacterium]
MNIIADRIAYFLKDFPPFSFLQEAEREVLASKVTVCYGKPEEVLFREGEANRKMAWVLRQGKVNLTKNDAGNDQLIEECEPGDVFGMRSLLSGNPYSMTATCEGECLLYTIPQSNFEQLLVENQYFALYFASGYAAGQAIVGKTTQSFHPKNQTWDSTPVSYAKKVLTCSPEHTIYQAAKLMSERNVGSIIISNDTQQPLGIVTDRDLRKKVIVARVPLDEKVTAIMSAPVKTIAPQLTISEVLVKMIRYHVHHLVVTEDGSSNSIIKGIVSDHDLMMAQQNHPAYLIKRLEKSNDPAEWANIRNEAESLLRKFLADEVAIPLISNLISEINDVIIRKAIELALTELGEISGDLRFCWLSLGSEGREEQLLRTDQDNAIIYADELSEHHKKHLLTLAERVNDLLMQCGFEECPANIMARNPAQCLSLSEWKERFSNWMLKPDPKALMNATIFFDFRPIWGETTLVESLRDFLKETLKSDAIFLNHLAANALSNPPPLSFFKSMVVEKNGEHKNEFDIKKRAMMPLVDAARLLSLQHGFYEEQNTLLRFKKMAKLEPKNADLFLASAQAYALFMRHRAMNGLTKNSNGRFLELSALNKLEKQILKKSFQPISDLQQLIEVRFRVAFFR